MTNTTQYQKPHRKRYVRRYMTGRASRSGVGAPGMSNGVSPVEANVAHSLVQRNAPSTAQKEVRTEAMEASVSCKMRAMKEMAMDAL